MTEVVAASAAQPVVTDDVSQTHLKLYISGNTARSSLAVQQLKAVCEAYLPGAYLLEIIDIYQNPREARDDRIVAVPTLVKVAPDFTRRLIGDLSDLSKLKLFLGIDPAAEAQS
ncbi:circadian clock KaiB family protein [Pseudomonas sp. CDFA 602]|uniref:circadian clock KaiB family protein n=1 Tax=Pseudomonas californiensis TaxID=2829823 RepID=UPI001E29F5AD|nr:circadian clock KaiB family protein [Pseudomonas californiensis]MCD5996164.1 circadian clock KaiB family protein [Pseudomonas californiensis]MCD6001788.1 circadian clock KaiB family protein [Pseudomonas californiensis]